MREDLPSEAKRVFKGKIFEVWQWEQKMFDGSSEIFEKIKRPDTASVFATVGDKIIFQKQTQPHLDPGEKIETMLVSFDKFLALTQQPEFRDKEMGLYLSRAWFDPEFKEKLRSTFYGIKGG